MLFSAAVSLHREWKKCNQIRQKSAKTLKVGIKTESTVSCCRIFAVGNGQCKNEQKANSCSWKLLCFRRIFAMRNRSVDGNANRAPAYGLLIHPLWGRCFLHRDATFVVRREKKHDDLWRTCNALRDWPSSTTFGRFTLRSYCVFRGANIPLCSISLRPEVVFVSPYVAERHRYR